jgi:hypothetical protein
VTGQVLAAVAGEAFPIDTVPPRLRKPETKDDPASSPEAVTPPSSSGTESLPGFPEFPEPSEESTVPPGGFESAPESPPPGGSGGAPFPGVPGPTGAEGTAPEPTTTAPAAPPFEASEPDPPEPWAPVGIGLGTGSLALGSVLFFGRRFGW